MDYLYGGLLALGLLLFYFGYKQYYNSKELIRSGIKTKAKVIDLLTISDDDGYTYKPVFEYTDRTDTTISFASDVSTNPPAYRVGDQVMIVYDPKTRDKKIISFWGLYRWSIVLFCLAAPLLIIGGGYFLYSKF